MVRNRKKSRPETWSDDQLKAAIYDVKSGKSVRATAKLHKVPRETLRRHLNSPSNENNNITITRNYNFKCVFTQSQEEKLKEYLVECSRMGYGLTPHICRKAAYDCAVKNGVSIPDQWTKNKLAGKEWMRNFFQRNNDLSLRKGEGCSIARAMCFNRATVSLFFDNLGEIYTRRPLLISNHRVYNLDETATTTVQKSMKIIAVKGQKQVSQNISAERGTTVTTCVIISAGGQLLPPAMIFPRVNFKKSMLIGCYPGTLGLANKSGWMNSDMFVQVLLHFIKCTNCTIENPALLICDNFESHISIEVIDLAKKHGVIILTLPPHCSHKMQPLDVSVFSPFKTQYSAAMSEWMFQNPDCLVTIYDLAKFVNKGLIKAATVPNILAGFRATGIFPFNKDIFTDEDFSQSLVTFKPPPDSTLPSSSPDPEENMVDEPVDVSTDNEDSPPSPVPMEKEGSSMPEEFLGPKELFGLPTRKQTSTKKRKGRKPGRSMIATDTPVRNELYAEAMKRKKIKMVKSLRLKEQ